MVARQSGTLARAKEIYRQRDKRAREIKGEGKKIIGYFCCYPPTELITAVDSVPFRMLGDVYEPITQADSCLETTMCPMLRSCFDLDLKGRYDLLDGVIGVHSCDQMEKMYGLWRYYRPRPFAHYIDVPHFLHPQSFEYFKAELDSLRKSLEKFTGRLISNQDLNRAIKLHNEQRALVRELYLLRKEEPPLFTGSETTQVLVAAMSLPVQEGNELLKNVIREVKEQREPPERKKARLLVWGGPVDGTSLIELIEDCGADVVIDDQCIGTRCYWADVEITDDPMEALSRRYLDKVRCPRTYREWAGSHQADLESRFKYLLDYAREFRVNGVILQVIRYCDTHEYDAPDVRDYLRGAGFPVLYIEHDYVATALAPLRTRIQAFLETLS